MLLTPIANAISLATQVRPLNILWSSDQHNLHNNTPTEHVLANLSRYFYVDNDLAKVDMVVFGGDMLDRLVESKDRNFLKVLDWIKTFHEKCAEHNVVVRYLEGTASHDGGQPCHFGYSVPIHANVKHVDTLSVERFPQFNNLSVMYVPDNMGSKTPDEIWELGLHVLNQEGLNKVDFIWFHGGFYYQLPPKGRAHAHLEERWESIVEYGIFAGHIHIPSQKGKIYCSGSFDRIRHGEEHPKGGYIIKLDQNKKEMVATFYENVNALPYLTIWINKEITADELILKIHTFIRNHKLPPHSQLKIRGGSGEVVNPVVNILSQEYHKLGFWIDNENDESVSIDNTLYDPTLYQGVSLDEGNLFDTLYEDTADKFELLGISKEEAEAVYKEFK